MYKEVEVTGDHDKEKTAKVIEQMMKDQGMDTTIAIKVAFVTSPTILAEFGSPLALADTVVDMLNQDSYQNKFFMKIVKHPSVNLLLGVFYPLEIREQPLFMSNQVGRTG